MIPIQIAYTKVGRLGSVSGVIEHTGTELCCWVIFHELGGPRRHFIYACDYSEDKFEECIDRLKGSIMKHSARQQQIVYHEQLRVFGSTEMLVEELHKRMSQQLSIPAYDKHHLHFLVNEITQFFINP